MEAVAEETGHLEANKEDGFEDDSVSAIQDEEFDFDIGGPGDDLEEALGGPESTNDGLAYHTENNDALHDARTHSIQDQEAQEAVDESHEDVIPGQDQDQQDLEIHAFDTSVDVEGIDQAYHFDDARGDQNEGENAQQADDAQYGGESEKYQDDVYLEDTAEELGSFVDAGQQNEELVQGTTVATESVEFSNLEDGHFEDDIRDEGISAEGPAVIQSGDETQPPVDSNYVDEMTENEITAMEPHSEGVDQNTSPGQDPYPVDTAADQTGTGTTSGLDDAGGQEAESSKTSEQHPRVRVSYGTAEFYLFAEAPDADPDDYFFENTDVLRQPLSQFVPKLRQVITEDLQASDELVVKVDGLGLEFGEATTKEFLDQTTFGQVLELYDRLVKLDNDSSESPELYIYLETRPNCLHRLTELTNNANEGKGLSQVAFYYEGTPDFAAIEEDSNDYDGGHQDMGPNDNVSDNGSNGQIEGDLSAAREAEQPSNPFRLSESQQQAMDSSHSALVEGEVVNHPLSADGDEGHAAYEDDNDEPFSGEVQDDMELVVTEASRDVSAPEAQQDSDLVPGEDEDLAAEAANDEPEDPHYVEEDVPGREEAAGTEADAEADNENFQEDDGPTDGEHLSSFELSGCTASSEICACAFCMSTQPTSNGVVDNTQAMVESEVKPRFADRQLVEDALTDVHQALVATEDWSSNFASTTNARDSLATDLDYNNRTESTSADFNMQDYETAENDDYLDIGATEEEPTEPAEYAASAGTPEPTSHDSSATATLDGEGQGHGDDVSATQALADAGHLIQTTSQPEPGPPETETDEIHWNDDDDDENDYDNDEFDTANQNRTDLSPSSLSVKRGRQADEDDVGLGDDSSKSSWGEGLRVCANITSVAKRRRT